MRNVRRSRSTVAARRRTTWATFDDSVSVATGGTHYRMTQTSAGTAADRFYLGIVRGQNEDVGADIAGAPRPLNDFYEDWAFWSCYTSATLSGAGPTWGVYANNVLDLDLRSRRKLPELQMTWNYVIQVAAFGVSPGTFRVSGRCLIALP